MQSSKNIPFSRITTTIMLGCLLLSTAISSSSALRQDSSDGTRDVTKIDKQRRLQMVNSSKASKAQTKGPTKASSKASKAQTKGPTKAPTTTGATLVPTTVKGKAAKSTGDNVTLAPTANTTLTTTSKSGKVGKTGKGPNMKGKAGKGTTKALTKAPSKAPTVAPTKAPTKAASL